MYRFESNGSRKPLHAMVIGAVVAAMLLFSLSTRDGMPVPMLLQLGAVICLSTAVYLAVRYSLRLYRYVVEPSGITDAAGVEQADLIITEIVGKRETVVLRVGLRDISRVEVVRRKDQKAMDALQASLRGQTVFRYANTPVLAEACYIFLPEEKAVAVIPVDARMIQILNR